MSGRQILAIKCQKLIGVYNAKRDVEMLIAFEDGIPTEIICGQYKEGKCTYPNPTDCDFLKWTKINRPEVVTPEEVKYGENGEKNE